MDRDITKLPLEELTPIEILAKYNINVNQKLFCELYINSNEIRGNGVKCYAMAYNIELNKLSYNSINAEASRLLTNDIVLKYMNDLLTLDGFDDISVDKQLNSVIQQHDDKGAKIQAIREYNKLKKRITDKLEVNANLSYDDLLDKAVERIKATQ